MADIAAKIRAIRTAKRLNQAEFAEALGVTQSTVSRWERKTNPQVPDYEGLQKLQAFSGESLIGEFAEAGHRPPPADTIAPRPLPQFFDSQAKIPVYASVEGGPGEMVVATEAIDWAVRPWYLREVKDGYAVVVVGESMAPAYEPGDLAIVNPKAPLVRNKIAIFVRREHEGDFTATIKRLVRALPDRWIVEQFNPPEGQTASFELMRDLWPEAFRVVGKYDGG